MEASEEPARIETEQGDEETIAVYYARSELRVPHEPSHLLRSLHRLRLQVDCARQVPL